MPRRRQLAGRHGRPTPWSCSARTPRFSVMRREGARGYGRSLVDGYRHGAGARLRARSCRWTRTSRTTRASIPALARGEPPADVVIGSRYCAGGGIGNWPLRRRALSRFANRYVCRITGMQRRATRRAASAATPPRARTPARRARRRPRATPSSSRPIYRAHRAGLQRRRGAHHLHRPPRGPVEDVAQGHLRIRPHALAPALQPLHAQGPSSGSSAGGRLKK